MSLKVYRDEAANASVVETSADGTLGMYFNNELRAIGNGDGTCSIINEPKSTESQDFFEVSDLAFSEFLDQNGSALGADEASTCDALNAAFHNTGGAAGVSPSITSSLSVAVSDTDQINYILQAPNSVEVEWGNLPAGLSVSSTNRRNLIGSFSDGAGTYSVDVTAINYYGSETQTITFNVASTFSNTKSINFNNQDYLGANASLLDGILGRSSNGSGSSDAWTIHLWFKAGVNSAGQTVFYFGDNDTANGGHINLRFLGGADELRMQYGTSSNYLRWQGSNAALSGTEWLHIMITYDGGATGSSSGSLNSYYSSFTIFIDGVDVTGAGTWSHNNYGYTGGIDSDNLRVGRYASGNYMRDNCRVDELAIWSTDQSSNISSIYSSGLTHDLAQLAAPPQHWWRMGDGDTYPNIQDNIGNAHFVMYNMTVADIVTDAP